MNNSWVNGKIVESQDAAISIRDTGLLHGAGVFTTMRAYKGKVFRLADHLERIRRSCQALGIPISYSDEQLASAIAELLAGNSLTDARLRLTATAGAMSPDPSGGIRLEPNAFISATAFEPYPDEYYRKGMTALAYDQQKLNPYDLHAGHKTLNYFPRLVAMRHAGARGAGEALWFNVHNYLQSGSISNVFIVKGGEIHTPPTQDELSEDAVSQVTPYSTSNVLPGITRKVVLELASTSSIPVRLRALTIDDLLSADECFLTNCVMQVMPVCRIERKAIGQDRPGDLTQKLAMLYRSAVDRDVV